MLSLQANKHLTSGWRVLKTSGLFGGVALPLGRTVAILTTHWQEQPQQQNHSGS